MEEIVYLVFQFIAECFVQMLFWLPFELVRFRSWLVGLGGVLVGTLSLWARPHHIIAIEWIRTINLAVTPILLALFIQSLEKAVIRLRDTHEENRKFIDIYIFFFTIALIRFLLAK